VTAAFERGRGNACDLCFSLQHRQKCLLSNHPAGYDEFVYSKNIVRWLCSGSLSAGCGRGLAYASNIMIKLAVVVEKKGK
jgi:hypothetical protein